VIRARDTDRLLIVTTLLLVVTGVAMVYSASYIVAMRRFGDEYFFVKKHLGFALVGLVFFMAAVKLPYTSYRKLTYPVLLLSAVLLVLIFVPGFGRVAGGARRWIRLGPVNFQPSEGAKLAVVMFMAYSLSSKAGKIKTFSSGFLPNMIMPGMLIVLILAEPDLGTALTLSLLVFVMSFAGGVRLRYLLGVVLACVPVLYMVVNNFAYMMSRISIYLDPWKDPSGKGFQMVQSFLAFGSGGIAGVGLGEGRQKLFYLPEAHTDFIFSVIGEELGLLGTGVVIVFYMLFLYCGVRIALRAKDLYGMYLALGLTFMVVMQAMINMAVVLGLLPPKGLTLPFISYGGTSLVVNMIAVGIILNVCIRSGES